MSLLVKSEDLLAAGASIPLKTMMHFPLFQISPSSRNISVWKNFPDFPQKMYVSFAKISDMMTFFTQNFDPYSRQNDTFPPILENLLFPLYFGKFTP